MKYYYTAMGMAIFYARTKKKTILLVIKGEKKPQVSWTLIGDV